MVHCQVASPTDKYLVLLIPGNYDTVTSPLSRPGSAGTIFGQGGLIDAAGGIITDLSAGNLAGVVGSNTKRRYCL